MQYIRLLRRRQDRKADSTRLRAVHTTLAGGYFHTTQLVLLQDYSQYTLTKYLLKWRVLQETRCVKRADTKHNCYMCRASVTRAIPYFTPNSCMLHICCIPCVSYRPIHYLYRYITLTFKSMVGL